MSRLATPGRRIDRSRVLRFRFDGIERRGFAGDTLASALLAEGQLLVGRSFKYHRPRGIVAAGPEEPNALVSLGRGAARVPNLRATQIELFEGLEAESQNRWPSLAVDLGAAAGLAAPLLPAGFYYKTFLAPRWGWKHLFEPLIRRAAGLGHAPEGADPDHYEHLHGFCDLVVAGGGVAGLAVATLAARAGLRVMLFEQSAAFGGRGPTDGGAVAGASVEAWIAARLSELAANPRVTLRVRASVTAIHDHGHVLVEERLSDHAPHLPGPKRRLWRLRAGRVIAATGAVERALPMPGNDLPGVMLAGALRDYISDFAVLPGRRALVVTVNDDGYRTALALRAAGAEVVAVLDLRAKPEGALPDQARALGLRVLTDRAVAAIEGGKRVRRVSLCHIAGQGGVVEGLDCDLVAMAGGWSPAVELWSQCGGRLCWDAARQMFRPDPAHPPRGAEGQPMVLCAGSASGALTLAEVLQDAMRPDLLAGLESRPVSLASPSLLASGDGIPPATPVAPPKDLLPSAAPVAPPKDPLPPGAPLAPPKDPLPSAAPLAPPKDPASPPAARSLAAKALGASSEVTGTSPDIPLAAPAASGADLGRAAEGALSEPQASPAPADTQSTAAVGPARVPAVTCPTEGEIAPIRLLPKRATEVLRAQMFLDFQNDVKASDIALAAREGFVSVEHAKRYTTLGMGTDQGRLGNVTGLALLAAATEREIAAVGTTSFRPPVTPLSFGTIAGAAQGGLFQPLRRTPLFDWHLASGAVWEPVGLWRRARHYPRAGESAAQSIAREIRATRQAVSLLDASTLGKILLSGPDVGRFLDMLYAGRMSSLKPGRCRYGVMCNEQGFVFDDGVVARLSEAEWLVHTTSGGAERVLAWIEDWLQCEWPDWQVYAADLTEANAQIAVAGPRARQLLERLGGMDLSPEALPFMACAEGRIGGIAVRVLRISFTGELSFELAVSAAEARALWDRLLSAGADLGVTPLGTDALHVLRAEKGYIVIGDETDGTVTPGDLGLGRMMAGKTDFLGCRGLQRPALRDPERWTLVGLQTLDGSVLQEGQLALTGALNGLGQAATEGRVTSAYFSPTLGRGVALGLVRRGAERQGEVLRFAKSGGRAAKGAKAIAAAMARVTEVRIVPLTAYDPEGTRLHG